MIYKFEVDDALVTDFEAGLTRNNYTPESLWEKQVGDFARAEATAIAEEAKPAVKEIKTEGKVIRKDPVTDEVFVKDIKSVSEKV